MGNSKRKSRRGFTLIEVLVTMGLMGIVLPVAMRGMSLAVATASTARHKAEACTLAQTKLEEIAQAVILDDTSNENSSGDFSDINPNFTNYTWTCQSQDDTNLGITQLTVVVSWNERGEAKTFSLSTLVVIPTNT
jgi:prepilin-type N-terminal cleavage/methylation domain-containing protein